VALTVVRHPFVGVVPPQLGGGPTPYFGGWWDSVAFQPLLVDLQLDGEPLGDGPPLHAKPFAVATAAGVVGEPREVEGFELLSLCLVSKHALVG
jgi:hypothetical protein